MLAKPFSVYVLLLLCCSLAASASAPVGVPRELARERAAVISDLRYDIAFDLRPHQPLAAGRETLLFKLASAQPLLLDFREGQAQRLVINGKASVVNADSGHLVLEASTLRAGENALNIDFDAPVAPAGKAITRYEDEVDGAEYLYTLFVPMDASMAFPCFDQPDLKGRFRLTVTAPSEWTIISNTPAESHTADGAGTATAFRRTEPISTYLFAFAAGPFRLIEGGGGRPGIYVRQSRWAQAKQEAPEIQQTTAQAINWLSHYFEQPFPFPKYDMVLVPGLAYGGMEHAGATFLREESVLFRTAPTHSDYVNRDLLVLHELTHQWFGDFTTMRWFDDLWLKEGFAQYMAYRTLADLKPDEHAWQRFYEAIKPAAYAIDVTEGTTPIYQDIPNLKDAKSAYGAIVYSKAPALLKQLAYVLGDSHFRDGLRVYLHEHPYSNAQWSDLVRAFERVSGQPLQNWARSWIERRGMPQVDSLWSCDNRGRIASFSLVQHDVLNAGGIWPIATQVLLHYLQKPPVRLRAQFNVPTFDLRDAIGQSCPDYVLANDGDYAYGRFLLDARSQRTVTAQIGRVSDVLERSLLWGSLWESVRVAELAPSDWITSAVSRLPQENDELLTRSLTAHLATALHRYVNSGTRTRFVGDVETLAAGRMQDSSDVGLRIIWFRALRAMAETPSGLARLKALLSGEATVPGMTMRPLDRWSMIEALIAHADPQAHDLLERERASDHSGDGPKYAYMAQAATPNRETKQKYFDDYVHNASRPEDWIEESLGAFNYWSQSEVTASYLKPALAALPEIKTQRKIFFVLGWLNAFIEGQTSRAADDEVHQWLDQAALDRDLRLKVLEAVDELDRTVKIRQRFP